MSVQESLYVCQADRRFPSREGLAIYRTFHVDMQQGHLSEESAHPLTKTPLRNYQVSCLRPIAAGSDIDNAAFSDSQDIERLLDSTFGQAKQFFTGGWIGALEQFLYLYCVLNSIFPHIIHLVFA